MKLLHFIKNTLFILLRKKTIGARILLIRDNHILLVKHTYQPKYWYTIGGGVDTGESPLAAIHRELLEETGITLNAPARLFAVYYSNLEKRDDYIIFYISNSDFTQQTISSPEILEMKWFSLDALPKDISPATQRRIDEYLGKIVVSDRW